MGTPVYLLINALIGIAKYGAIVALHDLDSLIDNYPCLQ